MAVVDNWVAKNLSGSTSGNSASSRQRSIVDTWAKKNDPRKIAQQEKQQSMLKAKYESPWEYESKLSDLETPDSFYADWAWDDQADDTTKENTLSEWQTGLRDWESTNESWKKYLDAAKADVEYYQGLYNYKQNESNWNDYQKAKTAYEDAAAEYKDSWDAYSAATEKYSSYYGEVHPEAKWASNVGDFDESGAYKVVASADELRAKADEAESEDESDFYYEMYLGTLDAKGLQAEREKLSTELQQAKDNKQVNIGDTVYDLALKKVGTKEKRRLELVDSYEAMAASSSYFAEQGITNWRDAEKRAAEIDAELKVKQAEYDKIATEDAAQYRADLAANKGKDAQTGLAIDAASAEGVINNRARSVFADQYEEIAALEQERNTLLRWAKAQQGAESYSNADETTRAAIEAAAEIYKPSASDNRRKLKKAVQAVADATGTSYEDALQTVENYKFYSNQQKAAKWAETGKKIADAAPILGSIGADIVTGTGVSGVAAPNMWLQQLRGRDTIDTNTGANMLRIVAENVKSEVRSDITNATYGKNFKLTGDNIAAWVYDALNSTVESAARMGTAYGIGKAAGALATAGTAGEVGAGVFNSLMAEGALPATMTAAELSNGIAQTAMPILSNILMGATVAADTTASYVEQGYNPGDAVWMGVVSGAIEGITEQYSVENLMAAFGERGTWQRLVKSFLAEGGEEWEANILNRVADYARTGKDDFIRAYETYSQTMDSKAAMRQAVLDIVGEDISSFAAGALSGVLMGAAGTHKANAQISEQDRAVLTFALRSQLETQSVEKAAEDTVAMADIGAGNLTVIKHGDTFEALVVDGVTGEAFTKDGIKTADEAKSAAVELAMEHLGGAAVAKKTGRTSEKKASQAMAAWLGTNYEVAANNPGRSVQTPLSNEIYAASTAAGETLTQTEAIKAAGALDIILNNKIKTTEKGALTDDNITELKNLLKLDSSETMRKVFEAKTGVTINKGKVSASVDNGVAIRTALNKSADNYAAQQVEALRRIAEVKRNALLRQQQQQAWDKARGEFNEAYKANYEALGEEMNTLIKEAEQSDVPQPTGKTNAVDIMGNGEYMTYEEFKQAPLFKEIAASKNSDGKVMGEEGARSFFNLYLASQEAIGETVSKDSAGKLVYRRGCYLDGITLEEMDEQQKATYTVLDALAKKIGVTIQLYRSAVKARDNGSYNRSTGIIRIDINAGMDGRQTMLYTASHELVHLMAQHAQDDYVKLVRKLTELYGEGTINERIKKLQDRRLKTREDIRKEFKDDPAQMSDELAKWPELSWKDAYEEVAAEAMEMMLSSENVMESLTKLDEEVKGVKGVFLRFMRKVQGALATLYKQYKPDSAAGQFVYEMQTSMPNSFAVLQDLYVTGVKNAGKNIQAKEEQKAKKVEADKRASFEEQNANPEEAMRDVEMHSMNLATVDYAIQHVDMSEEDQKRLAHIYNSLTTLGNIQVAMGKINKGVFNSEKGRAAKNIHELNAYLLQHEDIYKQIVTIQNETRALGIPCELISEWGEDVYIEDKNVGPGLIGLPIEYVESTTGKLYKFTAFWRTLPQMYLDAIGYSEKEQMRGKLVEAVEDAYARKTGLTDLIPNFGEQFPGTEPTAKQIKGVSGEQTRKNVASKTMNKVQAPLRSAEKTVMALNLNSACPMFTVGNHGCYLDACYLTQMANGATGTNLFRSAWYTGELLQLSDETIATMNRLGGLRLNGVGDTTLDNEVQYMDVLRHAEMRGLKIKCITKQRATLETLARAYNQGINISNVDVQLSMDNLWLPAALDDVYGAGVRGSIGLAETVKRGRMRAAAVGYDAIFGRATQVVDGVLYRKYGFSAEQIQEMQNEFPFVHITPRYVVCTAPEMAEIALNRDGDIVNRGNVIQTLMHGKVPAACVIDAKYAQTDGGATPIINFGGLRHKIVKDATTGAWDFYGVTVKEVSQEVTINGETVKTKKTVEKKAPAGKQKPYNIVKDYVQNHYTAEEQETIWSNLRNQMCCQTNDYHDACAGCQSLCARGYACNAHQDFDSTQYSEEEKLDAISAYTGDSPYAMQDGNAVEEDGSIMRQEAEELTHPQQNPAAENVSSEYLEENGFDPGIMHSMAITDEDTLATLADIDALGPYDPETNPHGYIETYKSMSFWGYDENGAAMLRSPMAEDSGLVYLIPKDGTHNWYQTTTRSEEDVKKKLLIQIVTRPVEYLPLKGNEQYINKNRSNIYAKTVSKTKAGKEKIKYVSVAEDYAGPEELIVKRDRATALVPYIGNEHLAKPDDSNLFYDLKRKNSITGKAENCPARYNPYEHSSNSMLNDQFDGAYKRPNLVTVKMRVPAGGTLDGTQYKAKYAKDGTGWTPWKSGKVANMITDKETGRSDFRRDLFLSMYAAPLEIIPDSEVAQYYKDLMAGTKAVVPSNVVSPSLLAELRKIGVPIKEVSEVAQWEKETAGMPRIEYRRDSDPRYVEETVGEAWKNEDIRYQETDDKDGHKKITADMSDEERYSILKDKEIESAAKTDYDKISAAEKKLNLSVSGSSELNATSRKQLSRKIGEEFGIFDDYRNKDIELSFGFSKNNLRESLNKQKKNYEDFGKLLSCFDEVIEAAVGIEMHNRNADGYKIDPTLNNVYVLVSFFEDGSDIVPVKLEVKEFSDKPNALYVAISLESIKKDEVVKQGNTNNGVTQGSRSSVIRLADLFAKVNPQDESFLKYVPKQFFTAESRGGLNGDVMREETESPEQDTELFTSPAFRSFAAQYDAAHGEGAAADLINNAKQLQREIARIREREANGATAEEVAALIKEQEDRVLDVARKAAQKRVMNAFKPTTAAEARRVEQLKQTMRVSDAVAQQKEHDDQKLQRAVAWEKARSARDINRERVKAGFREQKIKAAAEAKLERTIEEMRADKLAAVAKERLKGEDKLERMKALKDAKIVSARIKGKFELDKQKRLLSDEGKEAIRAKRKRLNLKPRETANDEVVIDWGVKAQPKWFSKDWIAKKKEAIQKGGSTLYRWFVNELRAIENFDSVQARNGVQGATAGVLAKAAGVSSGRAQYIYTKALRNKNGAVIGEAFKDVFYYYNEDGTIDTAKTDLLRRYMTLMHTVDRMSLVKNAEAALVNFEAAHPEIASMSAKTLALVVTDRNLAARAFKGDTAEEVMEYILARQYVALMEYRNSAKDKPVIADTNGRPVSAETAQRMADELLGQYDWLAEKADSIYEWWDKFMREYAVGSSVSNEEYELLRLLYPHYIPTYRVQEGADQRILQVGDKLETRKAIGKATGSTKQLITADDCFANSIARIIKLNATNELYRNIYDTALNDIESKMADWVQLDTDTIAETAGLDFADAAASDSLTNDGDMYRVGVWMNGEKVNALVNKDLYVALNTLSNKQTSDWIKGITRLGQVLSAPMKAMITGYNPLFGARNVARDYPTAVVNSISGMGFYKYYGQAVKEIRKSENWENFEALGGTQMGYFRNESGRNGNTMAFMKAMDKKTGIAGVAEKTLEGLGWFNETTESVTRFAEYLATIDKLGNTYEGRLAGIKNAAEVTVDFSRRGSAGTLINAWIPYWNPAVQGIDKVFRSVFDTHDIKKSFATLGRAAATAVIGEALMQALLMALGKRKDWEELSDYVKDNYYCIPMGDKKFLKIPKNREWAALIGTPISRLIQYADGRADPFEEYFDINIKGNFLPSGIEDAVVYGTILDLKQNENYAGQAIVGSQYKDSTTGAYASNENIWDSETSEMAYLLSKAMFNALSPVQVDYIISDYCGDFVSTLLGVVDRGMITGDNTLGGNLLDIGKNLTKSLVADSRYSSQIQSDYYGALDELSQQILDDKLADPENYQNNIAYKTKQGMLQFGKEITSLNKQIKQLGDGDEKNALKEQVIELQSAALELYKSVQSGEITEPYLYAKYDAYGEAIRDELINLNAYAKDYAYEPSYTASASYSDPDKKGYEYVLTDEQKDYLEQLFAEAYQTKVGAAIKTGKYGKASTQKKAEMLEAARSEAVELAKAQFFKWLKKQTKSTKKQ